MVKLLADIGGTSLRLGIGSSKTRKIIVSKKFRTVKKRNELLAVLKDFILGVEKEGIIRTGKITEGIIAAAGPLLSNSIKVTNTGLLIREKDLVKHLGIKVSLINDLSAMALSTRILRKKGYKSIRRSGSSKRSLTIGVGTGLGACAIIGNDIVSGEAGHNILSSKNYESSYHIIKHLEEELGRELCFEDLLSGKGIEKIYSSFRRKYYPWSPIMRSADIFGTSRSNECSKDSLMFFIKLLAQFSQALALTFLPGTLWLGGGLLLRNPWVIGNRFIKEFNNHPISDFRKMLKSIGVRVIINDNAGLLGCLAWRDSL